MIWTILDYLMVAVTTGLIWMFGATLLSSMGVERRGALWWPLIVPIGLLFELGSRLQRNGE